MHECPWSVVVVSWNFKCGKSGALWPFLPARRPLLYFSATRADQRGVYIVGDQVKCTPTLAYGRYVRIISYSLSRESVVIFFSSNVRIRDVWPLSNLLKDCWSDCPYSLFGKTHMPPVIGMIMVCGRHWDPGTQGYLGLVSDQICIKNYTWKNTLVYMTR